MSRYPLGCDPYNTAPHWWSLAQLVDILIAEGRLSEHFRIQS